LASVSDRPVLCSAVSRKIPSFRILAMSVVLFRPSLAAAPFRPPTTQLVSRRVAMICALSASASVWVLVSGSFWLVSSATGARSSVPSSGQRSAQMKFCPGVPFLVPRCRTVYTQSPISDPPRHSFFAFGSCPSPPNLVGVALPKIRNRETPSFQNVGSKHSRFGFVDWDRGATSRVRQLFLRHSLFLAELAQNISKRPFWLTGSGGNRSTAWLGVILASSTT